MSLEDYKPFAIGTEGKPWGDAERAQWHASPFCAKKRDYFADVVSRLHRVDGAAVEVFQYGELDYRKPFGAARYPLFAAKSAQWDRTRPLAVVTGGVHGYETSGVHGALLFIERELPRLAAHCNILVLPCVSPWGYETINRWNPETVDPNRSFTHTAPGCGEAANAMACIMKYVQLSSSVLMHTDLHETTDTDNLEFRPAKAARDGLPLPPFDPIPDGFYLVANAKTPELGFQDAINAAVAKVTHIAPGDGDAKTILGQPQASPGVILISVPGLCGQHTAAKYSTTTEVYPDSKAVPSAEVCNEAQVAVVVAGLTFALTAEGLLK